MGSAGGENANPKGRSRPDVASLFVESIGHPIPGSKATDLKEIISIRRFGWFIFVFLAIVEVLVIAYPEGDRAHLGWLLVLGGMASIVLVDRRLRAYQISGTPITVGSNGIRWPSAAGPRRLISSHTLIPLSELVALLVVDRDVEPRIGQRLGEITMRTRTGMVFRSGPKLAAELSRLAGVIELHAPGCRTEVSPGLD
jgi:hypothetical protein